MAKEMKPKPNREWVVANDGASLVADLIDRNHGNLKDCAVMLMGKPKCGTAGGRVQFAKPMRASELVKAVLRPHGEEVDYLIVVGMDLWPQMPTHLRERVLDKALCYFGGKNPETGKLEMRHPDVAGEFTEIVQRYGLPESDPEMQQFVRVAMKQIQGTVTTTTGGVNG